MGADLGRLRKRSEFLAVAATNRRWTSPGVVLQVRKLSANDAQPTELGLRVGFTATRKVGNAVARNRAKRRLRAAVRDVVGHALDSSGVPCPADLVLVARRGTLDRPYAALKADLIAAMGKLGIIGR